MRGRYAIKIAFVLWIALLARTSEAASVSDFADFSLAGSPSDLPGRLYVPPVALSDPTSRQPLILFLHGAGEFGRDNLAQINGNIDNLLAEVKRRGAFLYAPQTPYGWDDRSVTDNVITMLDRAIAEQNVDPRRIYITGLSLGGGGVWDMLSRYDNRFAAAVPIATLFSFGADFNPTNVIHQSIWAFVAQDDTLIGNNRDLISYVLRTARQPLPAYPDLSHGTKNFAYMSTAIDLTYWEYSSGGHQIWPRVYNTAAMYDWMFAHSLAVPEPGCAAIVVCGLVGFGFMRRMCIRG